mmetsp:Transcript_22057/g.48177  ORF Transcript_22057/g.48177 Transcript_22057/m.48177 type:complete len:206 (-) Transcript_22057:547-1164(-)
MRMRPALHGAYQLLLQPRGGSRAGPRCLGACHHGACQRGHQQLQGLGSFRAASRHLLGVLQRHTGCFWQPAQLQQVGGQHAGAAQPQHEGGGGRSPHCGLQSALHLTTPTHLFESSSVRQQRRWLTRQYALYRQLAVQLYCLLTGLRTAQLDQGACAVELRCGLQYGLVVLVVGWSSKTHAVLGPHPQVPGVICRGGCSVPWLWL